MPAATPIINAADGGTYPEAGVTAANPATAPVAMPMPEGFRLRTHSTAIHVTMPAHAPSWVLTSAASPTEPAEPALPALNPNHPNQRMPAPSRTSGTL